MIYISHLLPDDEMKEIISQTGVGIESIEFSIADKGICLQLSGTTEIYGMPGTDFAWAFYEHRSCSL